MKISANECIPTVRRRSQAFTPAQPKKSPLLTTPDRNKRSAFFIIIVFTASLVPGSLQAQPAAHEIVKKMDKLLYGTTSKSRMAIQIKRPRYTRTMVLDSWESKKLDRSFIRLLKPKKDRGVTFLKWGSDLWQYIPKIGKVIKIEGSLMQDSWMGSDFTNDDLVRASSIVDDYTHSFGKAPADDQYRIIFTPKPGAPVVWGRIAADIRKKDLLPVKQEYFDHRNRLKKIMEFYDYRRIGGRTIPTRWIMFSVHNGKKKSSTAMRFLKLKFDLAIPRHVFSKANLRK